MKTKPDDVVDWMVAALFCLCLLSVIASIFFALA